VNRLSIGAQALQDSHLESLGRIHSGSDTVRAVAQARAAGFTNLSLDLMFGLPGQTPGEWAESLDFACGLRPEHLSFYGLTIEKGTRFFGLHEKGELPLPGEDLQADMYESGIQRLERDGLQQYEISNFARAGRASRHNQLYWKNLDTLGLGAGAWSFAAGRRYSRVKSPQAYMTSLAEGRVPEDESEVLEPARARGEAATLALRLTEGVDLADWNSRTGVAWDQEFGPQTAKYLGLGLLESKGGRLKLTRKGLPLANEVFRSLV
jgi:oxygen-independent coproporphyrinogen-3 oxidase